MGPTRAKPGVCNSMYMEPKPIYLEGTFPHHLFSRFSVFPRSSTSPSSNTLIKYPFDREMKIYFCGGEQFSDP